ncbi:hypothetical protein FRC03_004764 [Tulasnella sp. 419]|nr:hypothetical protein FRC03_004764 [Tulasnella sp. 419]
MSPQSKQRLLQETAIYHVLKAREEGDSKHSDLLEFAGELDIFGTTGGSIITEEIDSRLRTVIHCLQSQVGVDKGNINLLLRLLSTISSACVCDSTGLLYVSSKQLSGTHPPPL